MISIVLPTYNERENILNLIEHIESVIKRNSLKAELVVVDDNSPDGTADAVKKVNKKFGNIRVLIRKQKLGIGSAHMFGYKKSRGDIVIAMDTDLSHDPESIPAMLKKMDEGYDVVVGSRHIKGSYYEKKKFETKKKYLISKFGNVLITLISRVPIHDFTNGYRAIRKKVIDGIETESTSNSFLMEFLIKAYRKGFKITEIPVSFIDRRLGKSKTRVNIEIFRVFMDLLKYSK